MVVDVFISHIGADRDVAMRLHLALRRAGVTPWCAACDLAPGDRWDRAIPAALMMARVVVVLVSRVWPVHGAEGAGWYGPEEVALAIDRARSTGRRTLVVPVRLDGVGIERLPYGLRRLVDIEAASADLDPVVRGLGRALAAIHERERPLPPPAVDAELAAAVQHLQALRRTGAPRDAIRAAIDHKLQVKRRLRRGGNLEAGDTLGRYVLEERIGHGGFASVWRAYDPTTAGRVALKVLHGRWNQDRSKVERFRRGAEQMGRMRHPGIAEVLAGVRRDDGWHFFVMPWFANGDLRQAILRESWPMSIDEGLRAVLAISDALAFAHGHGVVHRDVKPSNILLDADGRACLSDFDLVRADDSTGGTGSGAMGTFLYAAPEQLDRPQAVGPAADVYGLGMTALFVLCGGPPPSKAKWRPETVVEGLPATPAVRRVLLRAIAPEAEARTPTARGFADALRAALEVEKGDSLELLLPPTLVADYAGLVAEGAPTLDDGPTLDRDGPTLDREPATLDRDPTTLDRTTLDREPATLGRDPTTLDHQPASLDRTIVDYPTQARGPTPLARRTLTLERDVPTLRRGPATAEVTSPQQRSDARPRPLAAPGVRWPAPGADPGDIAAALDRAFAVGADGKALARLQSPRRGLRGVPTPLWFVAATVVLGSLKFGPLVFAEAPDRGCVRVTSDPPGAQITLDGHPTGEVTPAMLTGLAIGRGHRLRLARAGHADAMRYIWLAPVDGSNRASVRPIAAACFDLPVGLEVAPGIAP